MGGADKKNIISKLAKIFSNKFFNKFKFSLLTNRNKVKKLYQILNKNINFKIIYQRRKICMNWQVNTNILSRIWD